MSLSSADVYVFLGPSLRRDDAARALDATFLPPVAQGDVYRIALRRPRAIGIVDGYFSGAPSVWHKEILWALSEGIPVFGSASMGALRAAELHAYGMAGVGRIFEAFRDGQLEDDDEVAVTHGPEETGYIATSEPMVNIRATLARAEADSIISVSARHAFVSVAKALFFARRDWLTILAEAQGVDPAELAALRDWLPQGRVDQKRADALAMLGTMRDALSRPARPMPAFQFERTHFFDELAGRCAGQTNPGRPSAAGSAASVIEELQLRGAESYGRVRAQALLRRLAADEGRQRGIVASPEALRETLTGLRTNLGLFTRAELDAWLARNDLDAATLEQLLEDLVLRDIVTAASGPVVDRQVLDELRLRGEYAELAERARRKQAVLAARGLDGVDVARACPGIPELRQWFFQQCLGIAVPDDLLAYVRELGISSVADLDSALQREWVYQLSVEK